MSIAAGPLASTGHQPTALPLHNQTTKNAGAIADATPTDNDNFVLKEDYYNMYAGLDEVLPARDEYAFGGDTEANTEDEDDLEDTDGASMSATEVNTEDLDDDWQSPRTRRASATGES
jgi:hypothetical protein